MAKLGVTEFLNILDDDQAIFFDLSPLLLVVIDKAGNIVRVNAAFEDTVGFTRYQVCGVNLGLSRFIVMDDIIRFIHSFDDMRAEKPPFRFSHHGGGEVVCRLIRWQYRHGRSFLIFARIGTLP